MSPLSPLELEKEKATLKMGGAGASGDHLHHANLTQTSLDIRQPSGSAGAAKAVDAEAGSGSCAVKQSVFSRSLAKSTKRGISSLLMPPSVRRKLEAVAEVQRQINVNLPMSSPQEAEDAVRFLLLETTRRPTETGGPTPELLQRAATVAYQRTYDPGSFESQFTARTERPIKDTHLRELYKVEQEMHDMSDALSSVSFTDSTISEVDLLEISPFDSVK